MNEYIRPPQKDQPHKESDEEVIKNEETVKTQVISRGRRGRGGRGFSTRGNQDRGK
jgi:hypothetical protein